MRAALESSVNGLSSTWAQKRFGPEMLYVHPNAVITNIAGTNNVPVPFGIKLSATSREVHVLPMS